MYSPLLFLHSWLRWFVLLLGLYAVARAIAGGQRSWTPADAKPGLFFMISLDLQLLIGLLLYLFFSPITIAAFGNISGAMSNPAYRFFVVEHFAGMLVAVILAHVGRVMTKKARTDAARFRRAAIFYTLSLLVILAAIPWPEMAAGRPLFRGM